MRSEHSDVPLGSDRISGSRVRLPVMITRLMLPPAISMAPFVTFRELVIESMGGPDGRAHAPRKIRKVVTRSARSCVRACGGRDVSGVEGPGAAGTAPGPERGGRDRSERFCPRATAVTGE